MSVNRAAKSGKNASFTLKKKPYCKLNFFFFPSPGFAAEAQRKVSRNTSICNWILGRGHQLSLQGDLSADNIWRALSMSYHSSVFPVITRVYFSR